MNGITATFSAPNKTDIYWLDTKFGINHKSGDTTNWGINWDDLGGTFASVPAAVAATPQSLTPNQLDVFGIGLDYVMYHKTFNGTSWPHSGKTLGAFS